MKQYLETLDEVLALGYHKANRTGVATIGIFGHMNKFDLRRGFPLLTTKKMYWKGIVHELLWFLSGDTNIQYLLKNNCNFWTDDAYRNYCTKTNSSAKALMSKEQFVECGRTSDRNSNFDLGYGTYGSMWRAFPVNIASGTIDQIAKAINTLRENPDDRRIIVTAWHPGLIDYIALPPCHVMFQFNTHKDMTGSRVLNLAMYQRSCDLFLGVPFNIASYALLLKMVAHCCNITAGVFTHFYGDLHIYTNHLEAVREQMTRAPHGLPEVVIHRPVGCELNDIKFEDIELKDYTSWPALRADLNTADITQSV